MPAPRTDPLSQRLFVQVLRRAIDLYMYQPQDRTAAQRVRALVDRNPSAARSSHVLHNLGSVRRTVLDAILTRADTRSSDG